MGSNNDYPLAPEKMEIDNAEKLVGNFFSKTTLCITLPKSQTVSQSFTEI